VGFQLVLVLFVLFLELCEQLALNFYSWHVKSLDKLKKIGDYILLVLGEVIHVHLKEFILLWLSYR